MIGVDTNILLRAALNDDPVQSEKALAILDAGNIFVPVSVMLEFEWVLRTAFKLPRGEVLKSLGNVLNIEGVTVGHGEKVKAAIDATSERGDFADFLHRALSDNCDRFASFDRKFVSQASETSGPVAFEP